VRLNELEVKIKIEDEKHFKELFQTCQVLFGDFTSHVLQKDEYFDNHEEQLKQQDLVVRIRSIGNKKKITLKSPRVHLSSGMTHRIELEFLSAEGETLDEQLQNQGLIAREASEKERWTFVYQECEIVLDRLPFIGYFVEIEGPSELEIQKVVELLGLQDCPVIKQNYGELMRNKLKEMQLPIKNFFATFEKEKEMEMSR
jgi:adenylate cyclase class 2